MAQGAGEKGDTRIRGAYALRPPRMPPPDPPPSDPPPPLPADRTRRIHFPLWIQSPEAGL